MTNPEPTLTPTEELVGEVLACRHRLGEPFFAISRRHRKALEGLRDKGLVSFDSHVSDAWRASLTDEGMDYFLDPKYVPPLMDPKCRSYKIREHGYPMRLDCNLAAHGPDVPHTWDMQPIVDEVVTWTDREADGPVIALPEKFRQPVVAVSCAPRPATP